MSTSVSKLPVLSVGVVNITTGKTQYDWSIYENKGLFAFLTNSGYLLFGREGSLEIGEKYDLIGNDSQRRLSKTGEIISFKSCENKDELINWLKSFNYDYTPIRAFSKRNSLSKKLTTSYSLK